jgi:YD repeat-containing protein
MRKLKILLCIGMLLLLWGCTDQNAPITEVTEPTAPPDETITLHLITEKKIYRNDGTQLSKVTYTYDEQGLMLTCTNIDYSTPAQSYCKQFHYNDHGHLLSTTQTVDGAQTPIDITCQYTYNPDGTVASIRGFIGPDSDICFVYNEQGLLTKITTTHYTGEPWDYYVYEYDKSDKLIKSTLKIPKTQTHSAHTLIDKLTYDDQGRLIRITSPSSYECEYDKYGNVIREGTRYYTYSAPDGVIMSMQDTRWPDMRYFYDELGRLVKEQSTEYYGVTTEYKYTTVQITPDQLYMSRTNFTSPLYQPVMAIYYDKLPLYWLPKPNVA